MTPQIDHVVVAVRDLERAASAYEGLGFTLTPRAEHPWGTANRLAQFAGNNFIELLEVDRPALIFPPDPAAQPPVFSFGAHNREFLAGGEGMSMFVLAGADSRADAARFAAAGLESYAPFDFERRAGLPDGRTVTVGFSLAFATHPDMPRAAFFTCHNRFPENFWKPAFQSHANGARAIAEAFLVAAEPARYADFVAGFTGGTATEVAGGLSAPCGPHALTLLTPEAFAARFPGERVDLSDGARFAAIAIEGPGVAPGLTPAAEACGLAIEWRVA